MTTKIYSIPAREVVPGMTRPDGARYTAVTINALTVDWYVERDCDIAQVGTWPGDTVVTVSLPGPSPRDLCPGLAIQLRLWPAPIDGDLWQWDDGDRGAVQLLGRWWTGLGDHVYAHDGELIGDAAALACFYLPEEPTL